MGFPRRPRRGAGAGVPGQCRGARFGVPFNSWPLEPVVAFGRWYSVAVVWGRISAQRADAARSSSRITRARSRLGVSPPAASSAERIAKIPADT